MVEIQTIIIAVLIMSAFVLGVSNFTGDLYNNFPNAQNVSYLDKSSDTAVKINEMQDKLQASSDESSIIDKMLGGVWRMFSLIFDVLGIFIALITDMAGILSIPAGFVGIFTGIITVIIIFGIAYLIMNMPR